MWEIIPFAINWYLNLYHPSKHPPKEFCFPVFAQPWSHNSLIQPLVWNFAKSRWVNTKSTETADHWVCCCCSFQRLSLSYGERWRCTRGLGMFLLFPYPAFYQPQSFCFLVCICIYAGYLVHFFYPSCH